MKKKIVFFLLLSLALPLALSACGGSATTLTSSTAAPAVQTGEDSRTPQTEAVSEVSSAPEASQAEESAPEVSQAGESAPETVSPAPAAPEGKVIAEITVRDYGVIRLELDPAAAPATVSNFVKLAQEGFYDGLTFHRIMDGFMIQGGDPTGTGFGGSSENVTGEFAANGFNNPISHVKGVISMARAQPYDSASSQFFITEDDATFLDGMYAAFGCVTEGMDVVEQIAADARPTDSNGSIAPEDQPVMEKVTILS